VLLIDEIDKADIEFPNDLLREARPHGVLRVRNAGVVKATQRPIVFITSTTKRSCRRVPRRCFFHTSASPTRNDGEDRGRALSRLKKVAPFAKRSGVFEVREVPPEEKSLDLQLLDWLKLLLVEDIPPDALRARTARPSSAAARRAAQDEQDVTCSSAHLHVRASARSPGVFATMLSGFFVKLRTQDPGFDQGVADAARGDAEDSSPPRSTSSTICRAPRW